MKFPKLRTKDYTMIAIIVIAVLFIGQAIYRQREGFVSKDKQGALWNRVKANFTDPRDQVASFVMAAAMPADDNLTITQSELDSVKAGTWDMAGSLSDTVDQSLAYLDSLPELNPTGSANEKPSTQKNMFIQVWPKFQKENPKTGPNRDGPTISEGVADGVSKVFKIRSAAPAAAPSGPSASSAPGLTAGTQSASCTQCSVVNGQISCACDVLPKA